MDAKAKYPTFGIRGANGMRIVTFGSNGGIYLFLDKKNWAERSLQRDELVEELKDLKLLNQDFDAEEVVSGRNLSLKLSDLSEDGLSRFLDILEKYCHSN